MIHDDVLLGLIKVAEGVKVPDEEVPVSWSTPVTVNVHGILMAGYIISKLAYMGSVAESIKNARVKQWQEETHEANVKRFNAFAEAATIADRKFSAENKSDIGQDIYLHLAKVSVLNFSTQEEGALIDKTVWRIRLEDISSFMVGHPKGF